MKKVLAVAAMILAVSCVPKESGEGGPAGLLDSPVLTSSVSTVGISSYSDEICLSYSWNDVAPEGTYPSYSIELTKASDSSFASAVEVSCVGNGKKFSSSQLAAIASELGEDIATGFDLMARVSANVKGYEPSCSNSVTVHIGQTQYEVNQLFIAGAALEGEPSEMTKEDGVFTWTGHLAKNADFLFPCQADAQWPAIVRNNLADEYWTAKLGYSVADEYGFQVTTPGVYTITIDASDSNAVTIETVLVEADLQLEVTELYIAGEAVGEAAGEAFAADGKVFTWEGHLDKDKEFFFPLQGGESWPALMAAEDGLTAVYVASEEEKTGFTLSPGGVYRISVNTEDIDNMELTITLLEEDVVLTRLFPVGGFDWGWNRDAAEEMTTEDGVIYTWRGTIWGGADFKFLCQKDAWNPGYTRDGDAEDYWTLVYNDGSLPDTQFQVSETGTYIITINLETLKIKVRKAEESPTLYLIGAGFDWGWSLADAQAMTTEDGITYTWTGNMWGNADFKILCQRDAWAPGYNRDASAEDYWTMVYRATDADPDVQFQVAENGEHTITVNIETMKMTVTKPEPKPEYPKIYPVGGIEDWGWDLNKIQPMETEDGITYTIVVKIWNDANFKFLCQNDAWAPGYTRDADAEDYFTVVYNDGSLPDTQFNLQSQNMETGNYKITLNTETKKLTFELQ